MGESGCGKSTVLNTLLNQHDPPAFNTSAAAVACTSKVTNKEFQVNDQLRLNIFDTMGFPDTDVKLAEARYDEVVKTLKKTPVHAILWILDPRRVTHDVLDRWRILFSELRNVGPPIILIVNGRENAITCQTDEKRAEKERELTGTARKFIEVTGLRVSATIVSLMLDELSPPRTVKVSVGPGKQQNVECEAGQAITKLGLCLCGLTPQESPHLRTIEEAIALWKDEEDRLKQIEQARMDKENQDRSAKDFAKGCADGIAKLEVAAASAVAGTVGAGLFAWTGIGAAAAAAAGATATALQITIELKKKEYEEAKDAANLTEQEVKEMRTNENAAIQIVAQLTAATKALLMMLVGAAPAEARMLEA